MIIQNSRSEDLSTILDLYRKATAYQRIKFPSNEWPIFDPKLIESEISEGRQWKLIIDGQVACIWVIAFSDPMIWEERNADPSIYIHRIATDPDFRGRKFVTDLVSWATNYAEIHGKKFIRMDTCGHNKKLIDYYCTSGFEFLGMHRLKSAKGLPSHYKDAEVCFFEITL